MDMGQVLDEAQEWRAVLIRAHLQEFTPPAYGTLVRQGRWRLGTEGPGAVDDGEGGSGAVGGDGEVERGSVVGVAVVGGAVLEEDTHGLRLVPAGRQVQGRVLIDCALAPVRRPRCGRRTSFLSCLSRSPRW